MMTMDSAGVDPPGVQQGSARWYGGGGADHGQVQDHDHHDHMGGVGSPYFSPYHHAYPTMNHGKLESDKSILSFSFIHI